MGTPHSAEGRAPVRAVAHGQSAQARPLGGRLMRWRACHLALFGQLALFRLLPFRALWRRRGRRGLHGGRARVGLRRRGGAGRGRAAASLLRGPACPCRSVSKRGPAGATRARRRARVRHLASDAFCRCSAITSPTSSCFVRTVRCSPRRSPRSCPAAAPACMERAGSAAHALPNVPRPRMHSAWTQRRMPHAPLPHAVPDLRTYMLAVRPAREALA